LWLGFGLNTTPDGGRHGALALDEAKSASSRWIVSALVSAFDAKMFPGVAGRTEGHEVRQLVASAEPKGVLVVQMQRDLIVLGSTIVTPCAVAITNCNASPRPIARVPSLSAARRLRDA